MPTHAQSILADDKRVHDDNRKGCNQLLRRLCENHPDRPEMQLVNSNDLIFYYAEPPL